MDNNCYMLNASMLTNYRYVLDRGGASILHAGVRGCYRQTVTLGSSISAVRPSCQVRGGCQASIGSTVAQYRMILA